MLWICSGRMLASASCKGIALEGAQGASTCAEGFCLHMAAMITVPYRSALRNLQTLIRSIAIVP